MYICMIKHTDKQGNKDPRLSIEITSPEVMTLPLTFSYYVVVHSMVRLGVSIKVGVFFNFKLK